MSSKLYVEGGGAKDVRIRCQRAFRKLLEKCGFGAQRRMPGIVACGSRNDAYDDFCTAHKCAASSDFVGLLVDSEDPIEDIDKTWQHLKARDNWNRPAGAVDEQALLMVTCMETWIACDLEALKSACKVLQDNALPSLIDMESRSRQSIQESLKQATRNCKRGYEKGQVSFRFLEEVNPVVLKKHLPSFRRFRRILEERL